MNAFHTAVKIYWFGKIDEEFEFTNKWFGVFVRRKLNDMRYINKERKFKSVTTPTRIIIWRVK